MAPLDASTLGDVSDEAPAGADLELDPEFNELEQAAKGKPEVQYGSTIEPAVPPDWKLAIQLAESLQKRTRDLRVMTHLATARLHTSGLTGFASGMRMIREQLDTRWATVHPQLDPEDDNDPMQRANAVLRLQDPARVLRTLRDTPLASTARTGPVCWRDIAVQIGAIELEPGREKMSESAILAAFAGTDAAQLQALRDAVDQAVEDAVAIPAAFDREAGAGSGPDFEALSKQLREIQRELGRFKSAVSQVEGTAEADPAGDAPAETPPGGAPVAAAPSRAATIQSILVLTKRDDAVHALELATAYFRAHEPSSPLPMLIDRAKRLASMDFMDILKDLAPDGLSQAKIIAGPSAE